MIVRPPYVVVITAPSAGVGKSTLASNLAVYLKGLAEDLPVAYASFDSVAAGDAMFALPGCTTGSLDDLQQGVRLQDLLVIGEFGVEFCSAGSQNGSMESANWLRKKLAQADYDGILILDIANGRPLLSAAIWAADLLLVLIKDPAALGETVRLRKELLASGGRAEQFWLLPSELGEESRYQRQASLAEFLRFAAEERGFQVLGETLVADSRVREQAVELAKPVLTRAPQSLLHLQLKQLAELVLQQREQQGSYTCRVERFRRDGLLPARAGLVGLVCPVCQQGVLSAEVQYLESYPARRRMLLHCSCVGGLLKGTGAEVFHATAGSLLIQSGAAHGGSAKELRLQVLSPAFDLLSSELMTPSHAWEVLLQYATGRCLAELYQEILLISRPVSAVEALSPEWYETFVTLRRRLRQLCREEKI